MKYLEVWFEFPNVQMFLAVFLLLISNCIALWSESVVCVTSVDTTFRAHRWVVTPLAPGKLCSPLHSSVSFSAPPPGLHSTQLLTPQATS